MLKLVIINLQIYFIVHESTKLTTKSIKRFIFNSFVSNELELELNLEKYSI